MRLMRWIVVLCLPAFAGLAHAGDIYTCKGADGVNTYQSAPCANPAAELSHRQYDQGLARSAARSTEHPGRMPDPSPASPVPAPPAAAYSAASRQPTAGYLCTNDKGSWIQLEPCPTITTRTERTDVYSYVTSTGERVNSTGYAQKPVPIHQRELDQDALCGQVLAGARFGRGLSDTQQSYERNKIKRNQCGG